MRFAARNNSMRIRWNSRRGLRSVSSSRRTRWSLSRPWRWRLWSSDRKWDDRRANRWPRSSSSRTWTKTFTWIQLARSYPRMPCSSSSSALDGVDDLITLVSANHKRVWGWARRRWWTMIGYRNFTWMCSRSSYLSIRQMKRSATAQ